MIQLLLLLAKLVLVGTSGIRVIKLLPHSLLLCWCILSRRRSDLVDAPAQLLDVLLCRTGRPCIGTRLRLGLIIILRGGASLVLR